MKGEGVINILRQHLGDFQNLMHAYQGEGGQKPPKNMII